MNSTTMFLGVAIVVGSASYYAYKNNFDPEEIKKNLIYDKDRFLILLEEVLAWSYEKMMKVFQKIREMIYDLIDSLKIKKELEELG